VKFGIREVAKISNVCKSDDVAGKTGKGVEKGERERKVS